MKNVIGAILFIISTIWSILLFLGNADLTLDQLFMNFIWHWVIISIMVILSCILLAVDGDFFEGIDFFDGDWGGGDGGSDCGCGD